MPRQMLNGCHVKGFITWVIDFCFCLEDQFINIIIDFALVKTFSQILLEESSSGGYVWNYR